MSDKPRTDWVSFSLGGLWAMEKDGGLLVPKCHPLSSSERAERLISYAAQGLGVPGFCIEMHPSGVWEVFVGNGTLRLLFDHSEKMRSDERPSMYPNTLIAAHCVPRSPAANAQAVLAYGETDRR
jgi:hypothetical protein